MNDILEIIKSAKGDMTVTKEEMEMLGTHLKALEKQAEIGQMYCESLKQDILKLCALTVPQIKSSILDNLLKSADIEDLMELKKAFSKNADGLIPPTVQLAPKKNRENTVNADFKF